MEISNLSPGGQKNRWQPGLVSGIWKGGSLVGLSPLTLHTWGCSSWMVLEPNPICRTLSPCLLRIRALLGAGNTEHHLSTCLRAPWRQAVLFSASPASTSQALMELWQKQTNKQTKPSICPGPLWYGDGVALSSRPPPSRGPGTPSPPLHGQNRRKRQLLSEFHIFSRRSSHQKIQSKS